MSTEASLANGPAAKLDPQIKLELEAAAFRGLVQHLQDRKDVQNIDLMNLAGFCRNCLAKWYLAAARERDVAMDYDGAREVVYGMTYDQWKDNHQAPATAEQKQKFQDTAHLHANIPGAK
ncbi:MULTISPECIES: DUF1244 domain-containing protein [Thalassospira]|uniref:SMc04008-like domain-containing protein n=2 Tax=Thalassospira TaxID=168934 RepID=A0ABR5Y087_9PROT|nr:hypothetical protein AUP40_18885 [Thalassospira xiamenensis]MAL28719.1 DUF1244 domain-containing protein [Thalassospira sp.]MBR9779262.1 DUF1244 domain-containing protein [Rhodospirillales bacterium]QPL37979.1 DUF1244 domain-containing protein [Thalassospira sp. B30-1]KZD08533.1 hypothetical protein AUP45_16185 [Thalassospira xiamenensis]